MRSKASEKKPRPDPEGLHLAWARGLDVRAVRELEAAAEARRSGPHPIPGRPKPAKPKAPAKHAPVSAAERTIPMFSRRDLAPQQDRNAPLLGRGPRVRPAVFRDVASSLPYMQTLSTHLVTERAREVPLCGATRHHVRAPIETPGKAVCAHCRAEASKLDAEVVR